MASLCFQYTFIYLPFSIDSFFPPSSCHVIFSLSFLYVILLLLCFLSKLHMYNSWELCVYKTFMRIFYSSIFNNIKVILSSFSFLKWFFTGLQVTSPGYRLQLLEHSDLAQTLLLSMAALENQPDIKLKLLQTLQFLSCSSGQYLIFKNVVHMEESSCWTCQSHRLTSFIK